MSTMKDEISIFIEKLGNDHQILNFLYNMKNQEFDRTKDSVYYSGPYWDNAEIVALFETVLSGKWFTCGAKVDKF